MNGKYKVIRSSVGLRTIYTTHPPKTFWRVLGIVGGQDLVCRLPIVQGTSAHSFDPPPSSRHLSPSFFKILVESFIVCL